MSLSTNYLKIVEFYETHHSLDFEAINLSLADWFYSLLQNSKSIESNSVNTLQCIFKNEY